MTSRTYVGLFALVLLCLFQGAFSSPQRTSSAYKDAADQLYSYLDESVPPCTDFYNFACGGFRRHHTLQTDEWLISPMVLAQHKVLETIAQQANRILLPEDNTNTSPRAVRQAHIYYKMCVHKFERSQNLAAHDEDIRHLYDLIERDYQGWPILDQDSQQELTQDPSFLLGRLLGTLSRSSLIELQVTPNYVDQPSHILLTLIPEIQRFGNPLDLNATEQEIHKVVDLFRKVIPNIGSNRTIVDLDATTIAEMNAIVYNQSEKALWDFDPSAPFPYNPFNLTTASARWPKIHWRAFFKGLAQDNLNETAITEHSIFSIAYPTYVDWLSGALAGQSASGQSATSSLFSSARNLHNYLVWTLVRAQVPGLKQRSWTRNSDRDLEFRFRTLPPDLRCAQDLIDDMPYVAARLYVETLDMDTIDAQNETMNQTVNDIGQAFGEAIDKLDWMTEESKDAALTKADEMVHNLGFPSWILDDTILDAKHAALNLTNDDDYYTANNKVLRFNIWAKLQQLNAKVTDRRDFAQSPAVVNAWYLERYNSLTIPISLYIRPFFDIDYPASIRFGQLGSLIGHEFTHGFDSRGIYWDNDGSYIENSWLDVNSMEGFTRMNECVVNEYSQFCMNQTANKVRCIDANRTATENLADNGGLHFAYDAYQNQKSRENSKKLPYPMSKYSLDQIFFISFAQLWCSLESERYLDWQLKFDVHSPARFRVLGALRNMKQFRKVFKCKSVHKSYDTCKIW